MDKLLEDILGNVFHAHNNAAILLNQLKSNKLSDALCHTKGDSGFSLGAS
jgi:hypothetical protein